MRDYKNVKVPRSFRSSSNRVAVKRVAFGRGAGQARKGAPGINRAARQYLMVVLLIAAGWLGWQAYQTLLHAEMFQIAGVDVKGVKTGGRGGAQGDCRLVHPARISFARTLKPRSSARWRIHGWPRPGSIAVCRTGSAWSSPSGRRSPFWMTAPVVILIDRDGVVIVRIEKENAPAWRLPVVVIKEYRIRSGEQVTSQGMTEAMTLIGEIAGRSGWPLDEVSINAASPETLSVQYAGREIRIGAGNYEEKLRRLAEILSDGAQRGLEFAYVDLRPERQAAAMVSKAQKKAQTSERGKKLR